MMLRVGGVLVPTFQPSVSFIGIGIYTSSIAPSPEHPQGIKEKAGMRGNVNN
jgi:hypothetical protein